MGVRLVGANPGVTLFRDAVSDERVAVVSVWQVDWSTHGAGRALVLWHEATVRVVGTDPELAGWLAAGFTRHFPEVAGLPWPQPEIVTSPVSWDLDLAAGFRAEAAGITVDIRTPLDHRVVHLDRFPLGARTNGLTNVFVPCRYASVVVDGAQLAGEAHVDENAKSSSAFLAAAEVWTD